MADDKKKTIPTAATMQRTITTRGKTRITPVKLSTKGTKGNKTIRNINPRNITELRGRPV